MYNSYDGYVLSTASIEPTQPRSQPSTTATEERCYRRQQMGQRLDGAEPRLQTQEETEEATGLIKGNNEANQT